LTARQLEAGLDEVGLDDDRVASVNRLRLVPRHLHGYRPGDPRRSRFRTAARRRSCRRRPGTPAFLHAARDALTIDLVGCRRDERPTGWSSSGSLTAPGMLQATL